MFSVNGEADGGHVILADKFWKSVQMIFFSRGEYAINRTEVTCKREKGVTTLQEPNVGVYL